MQALLWPNVKNSHLSFRKAFKRESHPYAKTRRGEDFKTKREQTSNPPWPWAQVQLASTSGGQLQIVGHEGGHGACIQSLTSRLGWASLEGNTPYAVTCHCWEKQVLYCPHDCPEASWKPAPAHEDQRPLCAATKTWCSQIKPPNPIL